MLLNFTQNLLINRKRGFPCPLPGAIIAAMNQRVLPPEHDEQAQIADIASDLKEIGISKDMSELIARGIHSTKLPKAFRDSRAAESVQRVYHIIGGDPRFALWADKNPDKFYQLFARMIPQTIAPVLPQPANNKNEQEWPEWLTSRRLAYQEAAALAEDIQVKSTTPKLVAPR